MDPLATPDPWDPDRLRLPDTLVGDLTPGRRPPRHRRGEAFLRGPIPFAWVATACRLPGSALHVASALRFLCGRYRGENRWGLEALARGLRVSRDSARRGLHAAERAGLIAVDREPGCKLSASIRELPEPEAGLRRRPLYGPVPWAWWLAAARLPGKALQVATACWLVAGWGRSAEFTLALGGWAELGLSRSSAARGLGTLAGAGLVAVEQRSGRKPVVTVLDGPQWPPGSRDVESNGRAAGSP